MRSLAPMIVVAALVAGATSASAIVFGGTNLGIFGYPAHQCGDKPRKPFRPFSFQYQWEIDSYNSDVRRYNARISEFLDCVQTYIDNAKNDMERIQEKIRDAVSES